MVVKKFIININFIIYHLYPFFSLFQEKKAAKLLSEKNIKLAIAESCTGGLISSRLTDIPGSSLYIFQNFITYSNEAKIQLLNVKRETIQKYGVVSSEVAIEMTKGLLENHNCDIALSITGIAGPDGGSIEKPVGLVYIAVADKNTSKVFKLEANPLLSRRLIKYAASCKALDLLCEFILINYKS